MRRLRFLFPAETRFLPLLAWLCIGSVITAGEPAAALPGGAAVPPKPVVSPNPPPLPGATTAGAALGVWIREDGSVDEVTVVRCSEAWREAVVNTVRRWRFEPVKWEGRAVPARVEVSFAQHGREVWADFSPVPNLPGELHSIKEFGLTPPVLQDNPEIVLPLQARIAFTQLAVSLQYVVEADGATGRFVPVAAPNELLLRATLDLVAARRYTPALIRSTPVAVAFDQDVTFIGRNEAIPALDGVLEAVDPVFPYERLLAGDEGQARVRFTLAPDGAVTGATVLEATHPDFGGALVAAVETWRFTPAAAAGQAEREYAHEFALTGVAHGARRLAGLLQAHGVIAKSAGGLDARPQVLARPPMVYPHALFAEGVEGTAVVELVVERTGLALLPRVVSASRPEFGWAGAAFAGGMRFKPLTRGGQPTELQITLPLKFTPPRAAAEAKTGG